MSILILIDVQYSQKAVFSFAKGWFESSKSLLLRFPSPSKKNPPQANFLPTPYRYLENPVFYVCSKMLTGSDLLSAEFCSDQPSLTLRIVSPICVFPRLHVAL